MPLVGKNPADRHHAHMRWAERYARNGNMPGAIAHFGRALDYDDRASAFGAERDQRRDEPAFGSPVRLHVSIRCSCSDFTTNPAEIRSSIMETLGSFYPNIRVADTKVVSSSRWKGPCEVEGQWEGVTKGYEKIYKDGFPSVARKVLNEHGHSRPYDVTSIVVD
jgi:hypothetical protein